MDGIKLGFDLTIEQSQKLVMTPELIQAIQILQFSTQELDAFVQEQLLVNPVLEQSQEKETPENAEEERSDGEGEKLDWKEFIRSGSYDDISYK